VIVASGEDGKVRVYSPELKLLGSIDNLEDADNVRLDPQGNIAYVGYGDGAIAVIDPQQLTKIGDIRLESHPEAFQVESNGKRILVNVPAARQVAVIDSEKRAVVARWPIRDAEANFPMALDAANHRLFIACRKPGKVIVLDTETGRTMGSLDCCGDSDDLFYDREMKRLYVTGGEGCITVIDEPAANQFRSLQNIRTPAGARTSLHVPELGLLFVAVPHRGAQRAAIQVYQPAKP
jgi:DNA-binding beta-propeller fold protein YncE